MSTHLPYRTWVRPAAPAATRSSEPIMERVRTLQVPTYEVPDALTEEDLSRMEEWAYHEDESVALTLATSSLLGLRSRCRQRLQIVLVERALADAEQEAVLWTPLLDALAKQLHGLSISIYYKKSPAEVQIEAQIHRVGTHVTTESRPENVLPWLTFEARGLRESVAAHAGTLEGAVIEQFANDPHTWGALGRNPRLAEHHMCRICDAARERMDGPSLGLDLMVAMSGLNAMHARGVQVPGDFIESLVSFLETARSRPTDNNAGFHSVVDGLRLACRLPRLSSDQVQRLFTVLQEGGYYTGYHKDLILGPSADEALWLRAYRERGRSPDIRAALAASGAKLVPEIRKKLEMSSDASVLAPLLPDSEPKAFRKLLGKLAAKDAAAAVKALDQASAEQLGTLSNTDIQALLISTDSDVRLAAMRSLSRARAAENGALSFSRSCR